MPPPESKGGYVIQLNKLEPPCSRPWPRTSSESIRTNPRIFSAVMVKKITPFPHSELWGCEPGGGKGSSMGRKPTWSLTEERIQDGRFLMILFRNLVQPQLMRFTPHSLIGHRLRARCSFGPREHNNESITPHSCFKELLTPCCGGYCLVLQSYLTLCNSLELLRRRQMHEEMMSMLTGPFELLHGGATERRKRKSKEVIVIT